MVMRGDDCVIQTNGHDHAPFLALLCSLLPCRLLVSTSFTERPRHATIKPQANKIAMATW
jgi:hypothetical protein